MLINTLSFAQELPKSGTPIPAEKPKDSVVIPAKDLLDLPTNEREIDSTKQDSVKKEGFLKDIVTYKAKDYVSVSQKKQQITLYNEAEVLYEDMEITAGIIVIDYS